jgi:hypothetical protein
VRAGKTLQVKLEAIKRRDDELVSNASRPPPPYRPRAAVNLLKLLRASAAHVKAAKADREKQRRREEELREDLKNLWLRATCDQLYHTLPRELRDMIYEDITEGTTMSQLYTKSPAYPGGIVWMLEAPDGTHEPDYHCYKEDLVGREVFRELMQTLYRSADIRYPLMDSGDLQDFLTRDKWGLGIRPLDHLRMVNVEIHEKDFDDPNIHRNLQSLQQLKQGAALHVKLVSLFNDELNDNINHERGYMGVTPDCGSLECDPDYSMMQFFTRSKHDLNIFFERVVPLVKILRRIRDTKRISLHVTVCYGDCSCSWTNILKLCGPEAGMNISSGVWRWLANNKKRVGLGTYKCNCRS